MSRSIAAGRTCWLVLTALSFAIFVMAILPSRPQARPVGDACTARPGRTLVANGHLRLFSSEASSGRQTAYVCAKPSGRIWPLGSPDSIVQKPFGISRSWVAAASEEGRPQDLFIRDVVARGAFDGRTNSCRLGAANRPGQLLRLDVVVVTDGGRIGWSGEERIGYGEPVVGTCINGSVEVIARGADVETASLVLKGSVLTWMEAGSRRSKRL